MRRGTTITLAILLFAILVAGVVQQAAGGALGGVLDLAEQTVEVRVGHLEWPVLQPRLDLRDSRLDRGDELGSLGDGGPHHAADDDEDEGADDQQRVRFLDPKAARCMIFVHDGASFEQWVDPNDYTNLETKLDPGGSGKRRQPAPGQLLRSARHARQVCVQIAGCDLV